MGIKSNIQKEAQIHSILYATLRSFYTFFADFHFIPTFIMFTKFILPIACLTAFSNALIIPNSEAKQFLSRNRRDNGPGGFSEVGASSMKGECQDEQCDFEEYVEAKENETKNDGVKLREVIKINPNVETVFKDIYTKCYEKVKGELSETFDFNLKCLEVLEKKYARKVTLIRMLSVRLLLRAVT